MNFLRMNFWFLILFSLSNSYGMHLVPAVEKAVETAYGGYVAYKGFESAIDSYNRGNEARSSAHSFQSNMHVDIQAINLVSQHPLDIDTNSHGNYLAGQILKEHDRPASPRLATAADARSETVVDHVTAGHEIVTQSTSSLTETQSHATSDSSLNTNIDLHPPSHNEVATVAVENSGREVSLRGDQFSDLTGYDSMHANALEAESRVEVNYERPAKSVYQNTLKNLDVGRRLSEDRFIDLVFSRSDSLEAVNAQVAFASDDWSCGNSKFKVSSEMKSDIREFFFDRMGHFKPIDTPERQGQLLSILAPAIKKYFEDKGLKNGYRELLNHYANKGVEEARYLHDLEVNGKDVVDYFGDLGAGIYSFFHSFSHESPNVNEFERAPFVKDLNTLNRLCLEGKFAEARAYMDRRINERLSIQGDYSLSRNIKEHDCLCRAAANYQTAREKQSNSSTLQQQAIQAAAAKKSEVAVVERQRNQVKAEGGESGQVKTAQQITQNEIAMPPAPNFNDNKNDKNKEEISSKTSLKDTKTYQDAHQQVLQSTERFEKLGLKPISKRDLKHIVNEHTLEGSKTAGKSQFNSNENFIELVLEGWEKGSWVDKNTKIYDTGRIIGRDAVGAPKSCIKISLNGTGDSIRTVFPV